MPKLIEEDGPLKEIGMPVYRSRVTYLGIDPGLSGGLASINGTRVRTTPMPKTERDLWDWLTDEDLLGADLFAVVEKVQGFIGAAHPGSAMFKFGQSYGALRMALIAAKIPFDEATPQKWQKSLGIPPRKREETKGSFKNRLKAKAQQLFPQEKVTLATADALLIAFYGLHSRNWREDFG